MAVICISIYVPVVILCVITAFRRLKYPTILSVSEKRFSIYIAEFAAWIGAMLCITFTAMLIGFSIGVQEKPHLFFYVVCGVFVWVGTYITIKALCFRIDVKNEKIIVYSLLHEPRDLYPGDLISVKRQTKQARTHQMERIVIESNHVGRIVVENSFINYDRFIIFLQKHGIAIVDKRG